MLDACWEGGGDARAAPATAPLPRALPRQLRTQSSWNLFKDKGRPQQSPAASSLSCWSCQCACFSTPQTQTKPLKSLQIPSELALRYRPSFPSLDIFPHFFFVRFVSRFNVFCIVVISHFQFFPSFFARMWCKFREVIFGSRRPPRWCHRPLVRLRRRRPQRRKCCRPHRRRHRHNTNTGHSTRNPQAPCLI